MARPSTRPLENAAFAVISRLLSCLVTERILRAYYRPFHKPDQGAAGFIVVLSVHISSEDPNVYRPLHSDDIFVILPLHHPPVFRDEVVVEHGRLVGLVDPLDMMPHIYEFRRGETDDRKDSLANLILSSLAPPPWDLTERGGLRRTEDAVSLWQRFAEGIFIPEDLREVIKLEIQSSLDWQAKAYRNLPACPIISSPAIEWEQSLVAGHPTHPMHRARMFNASSMDYDWYHPRIRFVRVPRTSLELLGDFEAQSKRLVSRAAQNAGHVLLEDDASVNMPVHELQIENIKAKFQNVEVLDADIYLQALGQSSIRTVVLPDFPGIALKLAVGVKISSSLRTISHFTANFGPRFSQDIVPKLALNPEILAVELEPRSAVYRTPDPELAKHFTAVIRKEYKPPEGEVLIVVAALLEWGHEGIPAGVSVVEHTFGLDTEEKKLKFLDRYIRIACQALIPALIKNGVAFEAHAQNVLARFDVTTKELRGFVIRDLGGLRIHPPTLRESTGVEFQFLPGHCVATKTLEEILPKFYHTFVHNHIQRLIRLLGLHYDGRGWEILRTHMAAVIPVEHPAWKVWMDPKSTSVDSKCLMRMRMRDSYRDMVYSPYPNMIQYRPQTSNPAEEDSQNGIRRQVFTSLCTVYSYITHFLFAPTS